MKEKFTLEYPLDSGFKKTDIYFYSGTPCPEKEFLEENCGVKRLFITDTNVASLSCMKIFLSHFASAEYFSAEKIQEESIFENKNDVLLILGSGEKFKDIQTVLKIVNTAVEKDFNRNSVFIGIGGGVICDMTGFAASMFKRGVECEFVPTTLLADVDASIGGKTGCDFSSYKNMIGAFYPAKKIFIWTDFILSLPENEFYSGLAEAIKTALLFSKEMCTLFIEKKDLILKKDSDVLFSIIRKCAEAKAAVVQKDFREKANRAFLNLGHTFGHALESVAGLGKVTHGEGVAWGIARAADLSLNMTVSEKAYVLKVKELLSSYGYETSPLHSAVKDIKDADKKLLSAMHKDKKNSSSSVKVILQKDFQNTFITEVSDEEILTVL